MGRLSRAAFFAAAATAVSLLVGPIPTASATQPFQNLLVSDDPAAFTPHVLDGEVDAIAVVGNKVVLAGQFTKAQNASGGPQLSRVNILAFNRTTGVIDTAFAPVVDGRVRTLAPSADGQSVFVGGQFNTVNGQSASKLAKLNITNGQKVAGFNSGTVNALVYDLKVSGNRLFIGGQFTKVAGQNRSLLAELDPTTGALRATGAVTFAGVHASGVSHVYKFDLNPAGTQLTAIGNFRTVNGQDRVQIASFSTTGPLALLDDWKTTKYEPACFAGFEYYIRDIDYSPDGTFFATTSTGGYPNAPSTLCDAVVRWDASDRGQEVLPEWVDHSGGDSYYAVAVTGSVIYVGGHQRWFNNPYASDSAGPGSVSRQGIGAVDPANGVPLSWDPVRNRGRGVFDMVATNDGLWVGSDTDRIGHGEYHGRIAFFPLAGGTPVPQPDPAPLPVDAYTVGGNDSRYLYRVNAGGNEIGSSDAGQNWAVDTDGSPSPYRNSGTNAAGYGPVPNLDPSVPAGTPPAVFETERWSPSDDPAMNWDFPVTAGTDLEVRLYFANRYSGTSAPGSRVFDVSLEGGVVLDDYDIAADVGHDTGTMKSFEITSDGNVDIDFAHVIENPLVNAIEIVDLDAPADPSPVTLRSFDGNTAGATEEVAPGSPNWAAVRGGFWLDGKLYLASTDGTFTVRSFSGGAFGAPTTLDLHELTQFQSEMSQMTGLFYRDGYVYFTLLNDPNMYRRGFSVESGIVAALRDDVSAGGIDWRAARGMFTSGNRLYWSESATGDLHRVTFETAAQPGTDTVVSGPAEDGTDWRGKVMFALPGPPPNDAPTAVFTQSCTDLECDFDGTASSDEDGSIDSYAWNWGDGTQAGNGATPSHTYAAPGNYTVTLTVTDNDGATGTTAHPVEVVESAIEFVASAQDQSSASKINHVVTIPSGVAAGDVMVLSLSINSASVTVNNPAGWSRVDQAATSGMTSVMWTRTATAGQGGSNVTVTTSGAVRDALLLSAYRGAELEAGQLDVVNETVNRANHTTPARTAEAGSWVVSVWADKTAATTAWTAPAGQVVRQTGAGTGAGHMSWLMTDSGGAVPAGPVGGLTAVANSATAQASMATVVLSPAN